MINKGQTLTIINSGEEFELEQYHGDLSRLDLDTFLPLDDKNLEIDTKFESLTSNVADHASCSGMLKLNESKKSIQNVEKLVVIEGLSVSTTSPIFSDLHKAVSPLGAIIQKTSTNCSTGVTMPLEVPTPKNERYQSNSTLTKGGLNVAEANSRSVPAESKSLYQIEQSKNLVTKSATILPQVASLEANAVPAESKSLYQIEQSKNLVTKSAAILPQVASLEANAVPAESKSLYQIEQSKNLVTKSAAILPQVTSLEAIAVPAESKSLYQIEQSKNLITKSAATLPQVASLEAIAVPAESKSLYQIEQSKNFVAKSAAILPQVSSLEAIAVTAKSRSLQEHNSVVKPIMSNVATQLGRHTLGGEHSTFHRKGIANNVGLVVSVAGIPIALQNLLPVEGTARSHYELAPEMFWQYPKVNSYRVLFRNKYYLFEFDKHQVTSFLESDDELT
ncbi:hypothetical protein L1D61_25640 [Vibrio mediterranei]|uniref:Uncharacterized protein n=2 Tax=Vibrio mediterranei TaxID=689 RepID=A0A3G4VN51_9VIBR|nr:hypothetical protein ECB94_27500 [Vibrio mediterranei]MCG9790528.1 hypothetical protein [Vibrio mediterranei]